MYIEMTELLVNLMVIQFPAGDLHSCQANCLIVNFYCNKTKNEILSMVI